MTEPTHRCLSCADLIPNSVECHTNDLLFFTEVTECATGFALSELVDLGGVFIYYSGCEETGT